MVRLDENKSRQLIVSGRFLYRFCIQSALFTLLMEVTGDVIKNGMD